MKTIVRLFAFAALSAATVLGTGCTSTQTARQDARPAPPKVAYTLTIIRTSSFGDLTDREWEQVRAAVAQFLDDEDHPVKGEYLIRVELAAAAAGLPAGWADVKLSFKSAANHEMVAYNPGFGDYADYYGALEYRDYYPYELFPGRYYSPPPRFPHHRPDDNDHNHDSDHNHDGDHRPDPHSAGVVNHNPNDAHYHHPQPDEPHGHVVARHGDTDHGSPGPGYARDSGSGNWGGGSSHSSDSSPSVASSRPDPVSSNSPPAANSAAPRSDPPARDRDNGANAESR